MTTAVVPPPGQGVSTPAFTTTETTVATAENMVTQASYTDLATVGPAVTIVVPASGRVIVTVTCQMLSLNANANNASMSFALSGANTVAATDAYRLLFNGSSSGNNSGFQQSTSVLLTGLTSGSTTFTAKYHTDAGGSTTQFSNRKICVEPVDADVASGGTAAFASTEVRVATAETTTSNTFTDLATPGPAVTATVPASGKVKLMIAAEMADGGGGNDSEVSFVASGANTITAGTAPYLLYYRQANATSGMGQSKSFLITGLSAGSTTFTMKYAISSGSNASTFKNRRIRIEPVDGDKG